MHGYRVSGLLAVCVSLVSLPAGAEVWTPVAENSSVAYLADSVHRIGDHVYLVERGTSNTAQGPLKIEAPLEFDCSAHTLRMAWLDAYTTGPVPVRLYGATRGHYKATQFVAAPAGSLFKWACNLPVRPERLVNIGRASEGKLIQVDARSVSRSGAYTSLWTRYDYPQIQFDPPYNAPYDSKREFVKVNCETSRFQITTGYDFTADGAVTDNMIARDDAETPFDSSDDYEVAVKAVACGKPFDPETWVGIGGETLRTKAPLATDLDIDSIPASADVVTPAEGFYAILPGKPSFTTARLVETMKNTRMNTSQIVIDLRSAPGNINRVKETYSPDFFVDRDMLGLVQLKSKMNMRRSENRGVYVAQTLTVKGDAWKEGSEVSFATEGRNVPGNDKLQKFGMNCRIGHVADATVVNAGLSGNAWPLACKRLNGDSAKGYYVEQLAYFIITHEESKDFGDSDTSVDSVVVER
ncbi:hypothetical protein R70241_00117 [Paraburkholderia saeva]|nr:hypothetical protein R70241_00117 [Paraburkholderia saeva]